jgi:two-component system, NarL family, sensor histidine kinase UhpB
MRPLMSFLRRHALLLLDSLAAVIAALTFLQRGEPDLLFHAMWVILVIEAFAFGVRISGPRIALAAVLVVGYSILDDLSGLRPLEVSELLFTEWPLMIVIISIVAIMADRVTRTNRDLASLERQTHDQLTTAREDERRRLSADIHDGLGQTLTALVLSLDAAEAGLDAGVGSGPADASTDGAITPRDALRRAQEIAAIALEESRDVARRLQPARMRELGLIGAIRDLAAKAGRPVEVRFDPRLSTPALLPVDEELEAYRIVQEAITNAIRHASAATITVDLALVRGGRLQIDVTDDGLGFDTHRTAGDGLGLRGMRERATSIRGTLQVQSRAGGGTRIRLLLPVPRAVASAG